MTAFFLYINLRNFSLMMNDCGEVGPRGGELAAQLADLMKHKRQ